MDLTCGVVETTMIGEVPISTQTIYTGAKNYIANGYKTTVKQIIGQHSIEESLYTTEEYTNPINNTKEYKYYFDINESLNGLTYDLNGNNLSFKENARIRIKENKEFTLKSSEDAYSNYSNHQNGTITFFSNSNHKESSKEYDISWENFTKAEKFKHLKDIDTYIAYRGGNPNTFLGKLEGLFNYSLDYINEKTIGLKEYVNSFNFPKFQNTYYKHEMEAIINQGIFKFNGGRIQITTNETVTAYGGFGGGIVINVLEGFLTILRELGINALSLTDYVASFAKLDNTAVGIKNYGTVILGTGSGVQSDEKEFPEIAILIDSAANGIGLSMGSLTNPNRVVSRAYGVWNAVNTASTTMNSGFMEFGITNNTNNWVSLNVGRTYGIFNDHGTTTLNGFTKKSVIRDISIYGLITKNLIKKREIEGDNKIKNALTEAINNVDTFWDKEIKTKTFEGFFSYTELQILYKLTGGATTCYTNSYAIANADGRRVYKDQTIDKDDGIYFGDNMSLEEASYEGTIKEGTFWEKQQEIQYKLTVPEYYVLKYKGSTYNYHDNTYQKISNPLNHYFDFNTVVGAGFSTGINALNNVINTSWIGEDFVDDNIVYNILKQTVQGIGNTFEDIIGKNK